MSKARRAIYLDHSATTPTDPQVVEAMLPYFTEVYGNPSSIHGFGRKAELAVEDARETIARIFNCQPEEVIFTSGGSESDNLAIRGAAWAAKQQGKGHHLITTPIEHDAISRTVRQLANLMGFEQTILPVNHEGQIDIEDFAAAIRPDTTLASVIYANNEVGTIAPTPKLAAHAHEHGVLFHTDAVQAAGQLPLDVQQLGVDLMSISGHKFYGPKGVGALFVRKGIDLISSQTGGSHESGRRAGTHNTPLIIGMAKALELAYAERDSRIAHYQQMRDALIEGILSAVPDAQLTGHPAQRLPSHASFVFAGVDTNSLLMHLDTKGIAASGGSACKTGNPEPSEVLLAMGYTPELALGSLRLTVGQSTTAEDVEYTIQAVIETVERIRKLNRAFVN
ncbi:MAG TPA: cysteine desulfurase family protein [Phototrophicaceae bacterium]|nr:cysteine desulfurase family protein [Phototrophicaceae bacterium]